MSSFSRYCADLLDCRENLDTLSVQNCVVKKTVDTLKKILDGQKYWGFPSQAIHIVNLWKRDIIFKFSNLPDNGKVVGLGILDLWACFFKHSYCLVKHYFMSQVWFRSYLQMERELLHFNKRKSKLSGKYIKKSTFWLVDRRFRKIWSLFFFS